MPDDRVRLSEHLRGWSSASPKAPASAVARFGQYLGRHLKMVRIPMQR